MEIKTDPLQDGDNVARPSVMVAEFFEHCSDDLTLSGPSAMLAAGTFCTVIARRGERILLRTDGGKHRWESPHFLYRPKK